MCKEQDSRLNRRLNQFFENLENNSVLKLITTRVSKKFSSLKKKKKIACLLHASKAVSSPECAPVWGLLSAPFLTQE